MLRTLYLIGLLLMSAAYGGDAVLAPVASSAPRLQKQPDAASQTQWGGFRSTSNILQTVFDADESTDGLPSQSMQNPGLKSPTRWSPSRETSVNHAATTDSANKQTEPYFDLNSTNEQSTTAQAGMQDSNDLFTRLAVWTVIILCLCVLTVLGLRRWQRQQGILPPGIGQARVLETLALGPGRAVSLIQLGNVRAVVGTDGSGIKTIVLAPNEFHEELSSFDDDLQSPARLADVV